MHCILTQDTGELGHRSNESGKVVGWCILHVVEGTTPQRALTPGGDLVDRVMCANEHLQTLRLSHVKGLRDADLKVGRDSLTSYWRTSVGSLTLTRRDSHWDMLAWTSLMSSRWLACLQALVYQCRSLTEVDLSHCLGLSDRGLGDLLHQLGPQLTALNLSGTKDITSRWADKPKEREREWLMAHGFLMAHAPESLIHGILDDLVNDLSVYWRGFEDAPFSPCGSCCRLLQQRAVFGGLILS